MGKRLRLTAVLMVIMVAAVLSTACWGNGSTSEASVNTPTTRSPTEVVKPRPEIAGVTASTAGMFEDYVAILDVTVINNGSDGLALVTGNISQGGVDMMKEFAVYLAHSSTQTVRLVFPLKWRGGDWIPTVTADVP